MKQVWDDRFVSDNTIAQTVAQLRQLIEVDSKQPEIIVTHRGRGISFTPTVVTVTDDSQSIQPNTTVAKSTGLVTLLLLSAVATWWFVSNKQLAEAPVNEQTAPNLLILSAQHTDASEAWLQNSVSDVFSGLFDHQYLGKVSAELLAPEINVNDYLDKQWNINPKLNVVTTNLVKNEFGYSLSLDVTQENQVNQSQRFTGNSINEVLKAASTWLGSELQTQSPDLPKYLPGEEAVVELYMRGLAAENESDYDKAAQYFELALTERADFHMARLQLAGVKKHLGDVDAALVLLDTLQSTTLYPQIEMKAVAIRGYIYDTQGRFDEAKTLFEDTLEKYALAPTHQLNPLRFELSFILSNLNQMDSALDQLTQIEQSSVAVTDPLLFADTLQKKASILQSTGQTSDALYYANQALNFYLKLGKLLGAAKTHNLLARINTLKSDYPQAKFHLVETLSITRKLDYRLGIGAAINELVYILIREGDFDQAEKLTAEMQQIAIDIDYNHMLIAAKQHSATMAITRGDWQVAENFLQQQEQLAQSSNNQKALMTGRFLQLEHWIAKGDSEAAQPILEWLTERIDDQPNIRQTIALELKRAQLTMVDSNHQSAIDLLVAVKVLAESADDKQALVEINNTLAELYLNNNVEKALVVMEENTQLNAVEYPFLLNYSKALKANDHLEHSLAAAIECKNKSGQRWTRKDEAYLSQLRLLVE